MGLFFYFSPTSCKNFRFLVPILKSIKQLRLWWSQRCLWIFQRLTSSNGVHTCKTNNNKKTLCSTRLFLFPLPSFVFFSQLSLTFLHPLHCDCSAKTRLKTEDVFPFLMHNTAIWFSHGEWNELQCQKCKVCFILLDPYLSGSRHNWRRKLQQLLKCLTWEFSVHHPSEEAAFGEVLLAQLSDNQTTQHLFLVVKTTGEWWDQKWKILF